MTICQADGLKKSFADQLLFDKVGFKINQGDKVGLIGINGAGKTTLFRILTGQEEADAGTFWMEKDLKIAYMEQYVSLDSDRTAYDEVLSLFQPLIQLELHLEEINRELEKRADDALLCRQQTLYEQFERKGGLTFRSRTRSALLGLGFVEEELQLPVSLLSGGQRTRVLLAKILLSGAELLLLDEPTNHLDLQAIGWLEDFLTDYRGTVVLISHDRFFLDKVCNRMFELENQKLFLYDGNYTSFKEQKQFRRKQKKKEYELKQKEIHRIEGIIAQQKQFGQERNYITIRSKQKQIERIAEGLESPEQDPEEIRFSFSTAPFSGNDVISLKQVAKGFEKKQLFSGIDLLIQKKEHFFLIGPNGCGKTTLFRMLLGELFPDAGSIYLGAGIQIGYYDQAIRMDNDSKTVFQEISDTYPHMTNTEIRCALAAFLFKGDAVFKKIGVLSGGERARVALTKLMLSGANLFLLDEPTNHLDIPSKEALEEALLQYNGTLLAVSHDRYFINRLADHIAELSAEGIRVYPGNFDDYAKAHSQAVATSPVQVTVPKKENEYQRKKAEESVLRKQKNRFIKLEALISDREKLLRKTTEELQDPKISGDYNLLLKKTEAIDQLQSEINAYYKEWEDLSLLFSDIK